MIVFDDDTSDVCLCASIVPASLVGDKKHCSWVFDGLHKYFTD